MRTPSRMCPLQKKSPAPAAHRNEDIVRTFGVRPNVRQTFPKGKEKVS